MQRDCLIPSLGENWYTMMKIKVKIKPVIIIIIIIIITIIVIMIIMILTSHETVWNVWFL